MNRNTNSGVEHMCISIYIKDSVERCWCEHAHISVPLAAFTMWLPDASDVRAMKWASRQAYPVFMVTYLGCRSEMSAVGLIPGSRGYRTCGISHLSTVASQAGEGSKPENLSQAPTNMSSCALLQPGSFPALGTLREQLRLLSFPCAFVRPSCHSILPRPLRVVRRRCRWVLLFLAAAARVHAYVRACVRPLCCSSPPPHQSCRGVFRPWTHRGIRNTSLQSHTVIHMMVYLQFSWVFNMTRTPWTPCWTSPPSGSLWWQWWHF